MLHYFSIVIELLISILGLLIVFKRKKIYGWGIALTFLIYVFYDSAKIMDWRIPSNLLYSLFFIGTISALLAVFSIYREGKKKMPKAILKSSLQDTPRLDSGLPEFNRLP